MDLLLLMPHNSRQERARERERRNTKNRSKEIFEVPNIFDHEIGSNMSN